MGYKRSGSGDCRPTLDAQIERVLPKILKAKALTPESIQIT